MKIFLSCVSAQFKDCRDALASDLRAIGCEVRVQEDFQQGPRTLIERLEEYVAQSDRVVALIGNAYGVEASGTAVPTASPARSYTQWEYFFALGERLDGTRTAAKDLYVYFASGEFLRLRIVRQIDEHAGRQRLFREQVKSSGKHWASFDTVDQLCRLVLRDGWRMTERPHKPRNLPYDSLGSLFKGRETCLRDLGSGLQRERTHVAAIVSKQAVYGLGGVGKTRLAVEYALAHQDDYSALLFVSAATPEALRRNLAALCGPLVLNLQQQDASEEEIRSAAVLWWLREHPAWFLIFDSVDTLPAASAVERLLPQLQGGHVIITSRVSQWSPAVRTIEVDVLSEDDAVAFLLARTEGRRSLTATDEADARVLARELDGLALALEQAGAAISTLRVSIAEYLRRWREREPKLREWHNERLTKYPGSLATTWDATFAELEAPARALLQLLCWFAPESIPPAVLATDAAKEAVAAGVEMLFSTKQRPETSSPVDVEGALAALAGFSLLKWEPGNDRFRIHRLVEEITRERVPAAQREFWLGKVLILILDYLPKDPPPHDVRSWSTWEPLRPHVVAAIEAAEAEGIRYPTSELMKGLGVLLLKKALWAEAEPLLRRALAIDEERCGPTHAEVGTHLNNLTAVLRATNRMREAEEVMRRSIAIEIQNFGEWNPRLARRLSELGSLVHGTGRLSEAEPLLRRALVIAERTSGPASVDVSRCLDNLAQLLADTNRIAEAEQLTMQALTIAEKNLGENHPDIGTILNNLALLYKVSNRLGEAERLLMRALTIAEKHFGENHPQVADALFNLAQLFADAHRRIEAEPLMRRAVAIDERMSGPENPQVGRSVTSLSLLLVSMSRLTEAEPLMRRGLVILLNSTRLAGQDPPPALLAEYGSLLKAMGKTESEVRVAIESLQRSTETDS